MKLAFITDEATQSLPEAIAWAKAQGFDGLELRSVEDCPIDRAEPATLRRWKALLDADGLRVCSLASSFMKCELDEGMQERELEKLRRLCEAAAILECPVIRGFALFAPQDGPLPAAELAPLFRRPLELAAAHGLVLALESDPGVNTTNHAALAALLDQLNSPAAGAIFDPGNDVFDPLGESPYPDGYQAIAHRLVHVHVKDAVRIGGKPSCVKIGTGLVDYPGLLRRLLADGYDGWLSLEPHYRAGNRLSDDQLRVPGGGAFSAGGWQTMAECAAALHTLLQAAKKEAGTC